MKEWLNKRVTISINSTGKPLVYTALITEVTDTHISFTDKYHLAYTFMISDIKQINEIKSDKKMEDKENEME